MVKSRIMSIVIILLSIIAVLWITTSYTLPAIYKEDYSIKYREQLDKIFDGSYIIGERRTVSGIREPEGRNYYYRYYEWDIVYEDVYGNKHSVVLSNKDKFETQVYWWMLAQIKQYYSDTFLEPKKGKDVAASCYCMVCKPEIKNQSQMEAEQTIHLFFEEMFSEIGGDSGICLTTLQADDVFSEYPVFLEIYYTTNPGQSFENEEADKLQIENMISDIVEFSGGSCNLYVQICFDNGKASERKYCEYLVVDGKICNSFFEEKTPANNYNNYLWQLYYFLESSGLYR